jgi:heat-inducible transcriptional repressor
MVEVPVDLTRAELEYVAQVLTRALRGLAVQALSQSVLRELEAELARYRQVLEQVLEILVASAGEHSGERMYLVGLGALLGQPEFHDRQRLRAVISVLEQEVLVKYLLVAGGERAESRVLVSIGEENPLGEVRDLSLVLAPYRAGMSLGRLAVIGPKRMDYGRAVGAVAEFEQLLTDLLGRWALV